MDIIKELGLTIMESQSFVPGSRVVALSQLEHALEKLPVMYGQKNIGGGMTYADNHQSPSDTHKARLLGVEKIVKEPLKVEFKSKVLHAHDGVAMLTNLGSLKEFDGKPVTVVVTEILEGE